MDNTFRESISPSCLKDRLCCLKDLLCFGLEVKDAFGGSDDEDDDADKSKYADVNNEGADVHTNEAFQPDSAPPDDTNIYQEINEVTKEWTSQFWVSLWSYVYTGC